jgi:hypothetical protein
MPRVCCAEFVGKGVGTGQRKESPSRIGSFQPVKRHLELLTGRHEELTPMVLADVKQAASERALK